MITGSVVLSVATAPRVTSKTWDATTLTWDDLLELADHPEDHKDCGGYVAGQLRGTTRRAGEVMYRSAVTLDADSSADGLEDAVESLGVRALIHSTYSSTADHPRDRIIIPVAGDGLAPEDYVTVAKGLMARLGEAQFDPGSSQPERLMFWPSTGDPASYRWREFDGPVATTAELVQRYGSTTEGEPVRPLVKSDPTKLPGVVGAFNRAYTFAEAVDRFNLPYEPTNNPNRWKLIGSHSPAGMMLYPDGHVYSNHSNDPAYGMDLTLFDLVAIHRFAYLDRDANVGDDVAPMDRPSVQKALTEFVSDPGVNAEIMASEFSELDPDDAAELEWVGKFTRHPKTGGPLDCAANWALIRDNDPLMRSVSLNLMTRNIVWSADPRWRHVVRGEESEAITTGDRAEISMYMEMTYGIPAPSDAKLNGLLEAEAQKHQYHPVEVYLNGLVWDGTPRMDKFLPVEPTPYTRMVARKVAMQAVARVLSPGVKADQTLILQGKQGLGKTWFIDRMSRGWSTTLGPIGSKDTIMAMMRNWIVVADEGFAMKKADQDALKEFITRTHDTIRLPYARETTSLARRQVIWGTTNDSIFLRAQEGNRRYLVVTLEDRLDFDKYTDGYIDQVWAEAVAAYKDGTRIWLDEAEEDMASRERDKATEDDGLRGIIIEYLEQLVPAGWVNMTPDDKRGWMMDRDAGMVKGEEKIMSVCSSEIWEVALGQELGRHSRLDLLQISSALDTIPGWERQASTERVPHYGPQRVFRRTSLTPEAVDLLGF